MKICLGKDKKPLDFKFSRSTVKVTIVTIVKMLIMCSAHYLENCLSQSFHTSHADWYG